MRRSKNDDNKLVGKSVEEPKKFDLKKVPLEIKCKNESQKRALASSIRARRVRVVLNAMAQTGGSVLAGRV